MVNAFCAAAYARRRRIRVRLSREVAMAAIDAFVRGGGVLILLLIAGLNLRDWGRLTGVRLGACLAAGAAAYLIETAPGFAPRRAYGRCLCLY